MTYSCIRTAALVASLLAVTPVPRRAPAQNPPQPTIESRVEAVNLDVSVADVRGNFVAGLKPSNFRVLDDGAPQSILYFTPIEAPAQLLVLVETSPAVYLIHSDHLAAAFALVEGLAPDDRLALASYDEQARLVLPFTADRDAFRAAIDGLHYNLGMGDLNLSAAVLSALESLAALSGKKALLLLSTGLDTAPADQRQTVLERVRATDVTIFAVALGGELRPSGKAARTTPPSADNSLSFEAADAFLRALADLSGGVAFFPKKPGDFATFYRQVSAELRHQYRIGYAPPAHDGKYHRIQVELLDDRGNLLVPALKKNGKPAKPAFLLHTRPGYKAPAP